METIDSLKCKCEPFESEEKPNIDLLGNNDFHSEDTFTYEEKMFIKEEPLESEQFAEEGTNLKGNTGFNREETSNLPNYMNIKQESSELDDMEEVSESQLPCGMFYTKTQCEKSVVPLDPSLSDDDMADDDDDDTFDPDYIPEPHNKDIPGPINKPPEKRRCIRPLFEELEEEYEENEVEDKEESPKGKSKAREKVKGKGKSMFQMKPTTWKKVDINNPPMPEYQHTPPEFVETPQKYFYRFFSLQLVKHITYQTNLYANQKDIATSFSTNEEEITTFIAILLYMGIMAGPSLDDYWATTTRVPQVANLMSSKRFRLIRRLIHFNDNSLCHGTIDRFYKVRPLFTFLNEAFRSEPQTPKQSIDEVMVGYKGKTSGNLRQYIKNKPTKWGFKLFARASEDGFVHDMILYQGATTLQAHGIPLTAEQETLGATSQIVSVLASTMTCSTTAIFADNFFTSLEIVRYLKTQNCRYTGTARENRIGKPPLKSIKDMEKSTVPRGTFDYVSTDDGIMALRWKDNTVVTFLSNDLGAEPVSKSQCYSKASRKKEEVDCPSVIKSYNANMGGIDKSDMLVHIYRSPLKAKRWYMRLFGYCVDLAVTNAWLCYRRDCKALAEKSLCLKNFRLQLFLYALNQKPVIPRHPRNVSMGSSGSPPEALDFPMANKGHRCERPDTSVRFDETLPHMPLFTTRQTCKHCSHKGHIIRSNIICKVCKVHLCLNANRNCFLQYHIAVE